MWRRSTTCRAQLVLGNVCPRASSAMSAFSSSTSSSSDHREERVSLQFQRQQQRELMRQQRRKQQPQSQQQQPPRKEQHPLQKLKPQIQQLQQQQSEAASEARPDVVAINSLNKDLAMLQRHIVQGGYDKVVPVWRKQPEQPDEEQRKIFDRAVVIQETLKLHVERKLILPGTKHRHEFVALTERILRVYSCCGGNGGGVRKNNNSRIFYECLQLLDLMHYFGLELSHAQCNAAVQVAAREGRWAEATHLYSDHIDPDASGYLPVTTTSTTSLGSLTTVTGLYCIARAAMETGMLPVESVLDGVTNLTLVSPSDSESYVLAAGVALGHAGEWEALRNYLKTSYRASQLGQPLVAAAMHACVLCHRYEEAMAIFDELVDGELASASEWQWDGGKDRLHPACRDLAIRALGGIIADDPALRERAMELYREAVEAESKVSVEALCAVVSTWENDWEIVMNLFLSAIEKQPESWLVFGDDSQITTEQSHLQEPPQELIPELGMFLDQVMKVCNASQKFGLALLCLRLFEISTASAVAVPYHRLVDITRDTAPLHSEIVQSTLPTICAMRNTDELLMTTMVSLCGVKLPHEAINLFEAVAFVTQRDCSILRDTYDVYAYAESLRAASESVVYQSWEPVQRHIHRLTASFSTIVDDEEHLTTADGLMLSSALAAAIRECVAASDPESGTTLGRWVERRPLKRPPDSPAIFSQEPGEDFGLPIPLTDSLLSAAVEAFVKSGKVQVAENLIQSNLRTERSPSEWLLSYHEAVKMLFAQGQSEDGLALFRTVLKSGKTPAMFCSVAKNMVASGNWRPVLDLYRQALSSGCLSEELSLLTMESIAASGRIGQKDSQFPLLRSIIGETSKTLGTTPAAWIETNYWKLKRVLGFSTARLIMGWDDYKLSRLDELDLAIETLEKRSTAGLTPKNAVLFLIVQAAGSFEQHHVPFNATGLPRVPRDRDAWIKLLDKALHEAKETRLMNEPNFIFEAAIALHRLGCNVECLEAVNHAISRDLKLNKAALESAVQAGRAAGLEEATGDMRMLLEGPSGWK